MAQHGSLTFYHAPHSRSAGTYTLLEELGAPFELKVINIKQGKQRETDFLAVNPMGKVPAIVHDGALVTEQVAIFIYLADLFAEKGLAPGLTDPLRGPYLRWMAYYSACFEPALCDKAMKREPGPVAMVPYGTFDTMLQTLLTQLEKWPYLLGEKFLALDVLWGTALTYMTSFKLVPEHPAVMRYIERFNSRATVKKVKEIDARLAAAQS